MKPKNRGVQMKHIGQKPGAGKSNLDTRGSAIALTRREALWGGGAFLASSFIPSRAQVANNGDSCFYKFTEATAFLTDLSFEWDENSGRCIIREKISQEPDQQALLETYLKIRQEKIDKNLPDKKLASAELEQVWNNLKLAPPAWSIDFFQFDPQAKLILKTPKKPKKLRSYELWVGCHGRRKFSQDSNSPGAGLRKLVLRFWREGANVWHVELKSDYWSKSNDLKSAAFAPISFRAFVLPSKDGSPRFTATIPAALFQGSISEIFGKHLTTQNPVPLSVDGTMAWSTQNPKGTLAPFRAFGGQIIASAIQSVQWSLTKAGDQSGGAKEKINAAANMVGRLAESTLVLGDETAFHVHFTLLEKLQPPEKNTPESSAVKREDELEFKVANASDTMVPETTLASRWWGFEVQNHNEVIATGAAARGLITYKSKNAITKDSYELSATFADTKTNDQASTTTDFRLMTYAGNFMVRSGRPYAAKSTEKKSAESPAKGAVNAAASPTSSALIADNKSISHPPELRVMATEGKDQEAPNLNWFDLRVGLVEAPYALDDASNSKLTFESSAFAILYSDTPYDPTPSSYLWLDRKTAPSRGLARFDLTRAKLTAENDVELLSLNFRFADLGLVLPQVKTANAPLKIVPLPDECRLLPTLDANIGGDTRPRLIVEFPPQHVMEEAKFIPKLPPPPSVLDGDGISLRDPDQADPNKDLDPRLYLVKMQGNDRVERRNEWSTKISDANASTSEPEWVRFRTFKSMFDKPPPSLSAMWGKLPPDQQIYMGPEGLEPDAFAYARAVGQKIFYDELETLVEKTQKDVAAFAEDLLQKQDSSLTESANRSRFESLIENEFPIYGLFRQFYNQSALALHKTPGVPGSVTSKQTEFFLPISADISLDIAKSLKDAFGGDSYDGFKKLLSGAEPLPELMRARLSGPSRLVFAVNCLDYEAEAASSPSQTSEINFTLAGLTNWSRHELVVVRRAQNLYQPDEHGLLGPMNRRIASINDAEFLDFQGIKSGTFVTAQQRLSEVAESLKSPPTALETSIEIPSRLILSPNQSAQWRTPHSFEGLEIFAALAGVEKRVEEGKEVPLSVRVERRPRRGNQPLWRASLDFREFEPGLRAVYSPDFRPGFFWSNFPMTWPERKDQNKDIFSWLQVAGNQPPPRGPFAPWLLGREYGDSEPPRAEDAFNDLQEPYEKNIRAGENFDKDIEANPKVYTVNGTSFRIPRLIAYLLGREKSQAAYPDEALFRSTMDAYDRHELILLTSAHGLPVQGRRDEKNALLKDSDQYEPPEGYELIDVYGDTAYYRPKTLRASELVLTSLGGSFRHDTAFQPPAAARHISTNRLFASLSIERWQQWTALGRDIYVEIVYKGFLFPIGVRASLVKVTERSFFKSPLGNIKAYLRQRMFLRCGKPEKSYPAMRQPNGGRQFPVELLKILTTTSPDIVDPTVNMGTYQTGQGAIPQPAMNGRMLYPAGTGPGLVFWPRTALEDSANIVFDISVDGKKTRLPLIFADNTAVQNQTMMKNLVAYYNEKISSPDTSGESKSFDAQTHKRSMVFSGQSLRYCEELKVGDCTFETDIWTIKAQGRSGVEHSLEGDNDNFDIDAQMQGADQPPFFPAIESARLRVKQLERLSGNPLPRIIAQFDGGYVEAGFRRRDTAPESFQPSIPVDAAEKNALDVYLNFIKPVSFNMGNNGDRTSGIYSPGNNFVGLGREPGPVGGPSTLTINKIGTLEDWSREKLGYSPKPAPSQLQTIAATPSAAPTPTAVTSKVDVYRNYFSKDAKLLGVIRLDKLIEFLGIKDAPEDLAKKATELPKVKEIIEYGSSAMQDAEHGLEEFEHFLKQSVLMPLLQIVAELDNVWRDVVIKWKHAENQIGDNQGYLELGKLFPEIGSGLSGLTESIKNALKTDEVIAFALELSAVYQSGLQLYQGLSRIAANPIGRISEGARKLLDQYSAALTASYNDLINILGDVKQALIDQIINKIVAELPVFNFALDVILPPFMAVQTQLAAYIDSGLIPPAQLETLKTLKTSIDNLQSSIVTPLNDSKIIVGQILQQALVSIPGGNGDPIETYRVDIKAKLQVLKTSVKDVLVGAVDSGAASLSDIEKVAPLLAAVDEAITFADALQSDLALLKTAVQKIAVGQFDIKATMDCADILRPYLAPEFTTMLVRVAVIASHMRAIKKSAEDKKYLETIQFSLDLLSPLIGSYNVIDLTSGLERELKHYVAQIGNVLNTPNNDDLFKSLSTDANSASKKLLELAVLMQKQRAIVADPKFPDATFAAGYLTFMTALPKLSAQWAQVGALAANDSVAHDISKYSKTLTAEIKFDAWISGDAVNLPTIEGFKLLVQQRILCVRLTATTIADTVMAVYNFVGQNALFLAGVATLYGAITQAEKTAIESWLVNSGLALGKDLRNAIVSGVGLVRWAIGPLASDSALLRSLKSFEDAFQKLPAPLADEFKSFGNLVFNPQNVNFPDLVNKLDEHLVAYANALPKITTQQGAPSPSLDDVEIFLSKLISAATDETNIKQIKWDVGGLVQGATDTATTIQRMISILPIHAEQRLLNFMERVKTAATVYSPQLAVNLAHMIASPNNATRWPGLANIYDELLKKRNYVESSIGGLPSVVTAKLEQVLVIPKKDQKQSDATIQNDRLQQERDLLGRLRDQPDQKDFEELRQFIRSWQSSQMAAPLQMAARAKEIVAIVMRGQVFSLVDFSAIRDRVEQQIKQLVPLRANLSHSFGGPFDDPDGIKALTFGVFYPLKDSELKISTNIKVEFLNPNKKPELNVVGNLGPFAIKLIGDYLDAVTITFKGARFTIKDGGSPKVDLFYDDFKIGKDLEFVQKLQVLLSPEKGTGFFLKLRTNPLGIEAGYGLVMPIFMLGNVSFSNISLNASMIIPFDGGETRFRASLSRIDAPFTIAAAPYGGSGYFGIEADAGGIVGFDASFEYGGAAAFQFGPLKGQGRLMLGIYIRQSKITLPPENGATENRTQNLVEIMATFFVGGTASIWIFNFGASLYVRLGMSGGNMVGEATFTFSFSCGFVDFDYSITVKRQENKMGNGQSAWLDNMSPIQVASSNSVTANDGISRNTPLSPVYFPGSLRTNKTKCQSEDWATYNSYFAERALKDGENWL